MSGSAPPTMLGIDLGTSSVKVVAVGTDGRIVASAGAPYVSLGIDEGRVEQDPMDWIRGIKEALALVARASGGSVRGAAAIGLSAQMPTFVLTARDGTPARRAILYADSRADPIGQSLLDLWGERRHYNRTGVVLDGRYIVPMYKWVEQHNASALAESTWVLSAKDFLHLWLTGAPATDPSTASGFGVYSLTAGTWDADLCAEAGMRMELLPEIRASHAVGGRLTRDRAAEIDAPAGIPVIVGAADSVSGLLGMGVDTPGQIGQMAGSSTALIAVHDSCRLDDRRRYLVTPLATPDVFGLEADILSTGSSIAWLERTLGGANLMSLAAQAPPGSDGLVFCPYLAGGEQGVLWDPERRGALLGLSLAHGPAHIARALLEGICFEIRRCLAVFGEAGCRAAAMRCTGPLSRQPLYMGMVADVTGLECRAASVEHASAFGAALLAGIGAGWWGMDDVGSMGSRGREESYAPRAESSAAYAGLYEEYVHASARSRTGGRANGGRENDTESGGHR